jgi:hypothetical protein
MSGGSFAERMPQSLVLIHEAEEGIPRAIVLQVFLVLARYFLPERASIPAVDRLAVGGEMFFRLHEMTEKRV